jgi:hypothetical protein
MLRIAAIVLLKHRISSPSETTCAALLGKVTITGGIAQPKSMLPTLSATLVAEFVAFEEVGNKRARHVHIGLSI